MARTVIIVGVLRIEDDEDGITDAADKTGLTGDAHLALTTNMTLPDGKPFPYGVFEWASTTVAEEAVADDVADDISRGSDWPE